MKLAAFLTFFKTPVSNVFDLEEEVAACNYAIRSHEPRWCIAEECDTANLLYLDGELAKDRRFLEIAMFETEAHAKKVRKSLKSDVHLIIIWTTDAARARLRHTENRLAEMDAL